LDTTEAEPRQRVPVCLRERLRRNSHPWNYPLTWTLNTSTWYAFSHSPSELVFDFAQLLPGASAVQVRSRIVMSPLGAKLFFRALEENCISVTPLCLDRTHHEYVKELAQWMV
jgi:hypothetical protein